MLVEPGAAGGHGDDLLSKGELGSFATWSSQDPVAHKASVELDERTEVSEYCMHIAAMFVGHRCCCPSCSPARDRDSPADASPDRHC